MKSINASLLFALSVWVIGCSNPQENAMEEIRSELSIVLNNDSIFDKAKFTILEDSIIDSIQSKYTFEENFDFISFYKTSPVKQTFDADVQAQITQNINTILKDRYWQAITEQTSRYWEKVTLSFDGSFVSVKVERIYNLFSGNWETVDNQNLEYEIIDKGDNKYYYVNIKGGKGNNFYKFKSYTDGFCLNGSVQFCD